MKSLFPLKQSPAVTVGALPIAGRDEFKQTNEIKIAAPLLDAIYVRGRVISADARKVLAVNCGHWAIENSCHYIIDWNFDEDRSRIRTGYGPENMTRLRRFAISIIKSKGVRSVAQKMRELSGNVRMVFDYLKMTGNSWGPAPTRQNRFILAPIDLFLTTIPLPVKHQNLNC